MEVRFIRDYCAQSNVNGACIWSEIEVIRNGENIALGITPISSAPLIGGTAPITNGVLTPAEYVFTNTYTVPQYVEIDLGQIYNDLEKITVWHYYEDGRIFEGTKLDVSSNGINWVTAFDSAISGTYAETAEGLSISIPIHETSLEFTRANQSNVVIPHNNSLTITDKMTMEFWIKLKPLPNDFQVILDKGNISTSQYYVLHEGRNGNNQIKYRFGNGVERTFNRPFSIVGEWVHMAFVFDGTNMIFYENGIEIAFETFPVVFSENTMPLTFGRMSAGGAYLDAFLDNVRLWNIARSAEEINAFKNVSILGNTQGLIGLWEFNEGLGTNVYDLSPNANNGEIFNGNFSTDAPVIETPVTKPPININFGGLDIDNIFLGEKPIINLYLGDNSLLNIPRKPDVKVTSLTNSIRLDWAITKNTTSWNIYRSEVKGTLGEKMPDGSFIKVNIYTDTSVIGGTTYYYTVEAKNADSNKATKGEQVEAFPYSIQVYENKLVDFEGQTAWSLYDEAHVITDFGNVASWQGGERIKYDTSGRIRFELPIGQLGSANTGGVIKAKIAGKNEYTLDYEIRFDAGFPWSKGGKIPGLSGGAGYTGGEGDLASSLGDGFSVRMMWREDGRIIPYVYHAGMTDKYGDTFGATVGYFTNTQAHKVKYYVKLNSGANFDGILRIYIDDVLSYENDKICFRRNQSQIDTCHIAIFAGGSTSDWNMVDTGYIRLSHIQWQ